MPGQSSFQAAWMQWIADLEVSTEETRSRDVSSPPVTPGRLLFHSVFPPCRADSISDFCILWRQRVY